MQTATPTSVDTYITRFSEPARSRLNELRNIIRKEVPDARETISYKMPAYKYHGMLAYFAGYDGHIGFYPGPSAILHFGRELRDFPTSRGTVRLPVDVPVPADLVARMVRFRALENVAKAKARKHKK